MRVHAADGTEHDLPADTAYVIEPGQDAWVVGDSPVIAYEFDGVAAATFAKP